MGDAKKHLLELLTASGLLIMLDEEGSVSASVEGEELHG